MKKTVIAIVIILAAVAGWAGATHVIGGKVEEGYLVFLDQVTGRGPFQWTSESYERGFMTSRARSVLELKMPVQDESAKPLRLTFEHILRHGPLPAGKTPDGNLSLAPMMVLIETRLVDFSLDDRSLEEILAEVPQLRDTQAYTVIGLGGGGHSRVTVPAFEKKIEDEGVTIEWGGLACDSEFSRDLTRVSGTFAIPSLKIYGDDGHFDWKGINLDFDVTEAFPLVYIGNSKGQFGSLEAAFSDPEEDGSKAIVMKGIEFSSQSSREEDAINCLMTMNMDGITVDGETYGPGLVEMALRRMDGQALSRFQKNMLEIQQEAALDPEAMLPRIMESYSRLFRELSAGSPEIEISRLQFTTPMGGFDGSARVKYHGEKAVEMGDIMALAENIDAEARIVADENLVRGLLAGDMEKEMRNARDQGVFPAVSDEEIKQMANQQIDGQIEVMAQQKFVVRQDGKLTAHATFKSGELKVNDQVLMSPK